MKNASNEWRRDEAKPSFAFKAGYQWTQEDEEQMKEQGRPSVVFNRAEPIIDAVAGTEIQNKKEVQYIPRDLGDAKQNEILSATSQWIRDECDADDEEIEMFTDMITCGVGCTETRIDYDEDLDGKIWIERRDPMKMYWDEAAKKKNMIDRKDHIYVDDMRPEDVKDMWPNKDIGNATIQPTEEYEEPHNAQDAWEYNPDNAGYIKETKSYRVLQYEWWERVDVYRFSDPKTGKLVEVSKSKFRLIRKQMDESGIKYLKQKKKIYYRAFVSGNLLLETGPAPTNDFSFKFATAKRDHRKGMWYGLMRAMRDPSRWSNKFFVQILDVINSNSLGGVIAEKGAVTDKAGFEKKWANPRGVIWTEDNAVTQNKIRERGAGAYPAGLAELMQFAVQAIPNVTGVNLELLGLATRNQPGILEDQRKRAGLTILQPLFNAFRRYRKEQGRLMMLFIDEYIDEGRLIKILGENGDPQYIKMIKDPEVRKYDVIVEESPDSPNQKEKVWESLIQIMPALGGQGVPSALIDYAPLPSKVIENWKKEIADKGQPSELDKLELALKQSGMKEAESRIMLNKAKAMKSIADAEGVESGQQIDVYKILADALVKKQTETKE